jgi:hypothetical protein
MRLLPAKDAPLGARLALEAIRALLATRQAAALLLELVEADGRQRGGAVVLGGAVVDFVDGDSGVDDLFAYPSLVFNSACWVRGWRMAGLT